MQALESGLDATGAELAAFNCLLDRRQDGGYELPRSREELNDVYERIGVAPTKARKPTKYVRSWYAPQARRASCSRSPT